MRATGVSLALAFAATWSMAHGAELPVGNNASVAGSTEISTALRTPHSRAEFAIKPRTALSGQDDGLARPAMTFTLRGPAPIPLVKPPVARRQPPPEEICGMIETAAQEHEIPVGFLTRLIWRESRFRVTAVSHAGAQGIAQFMPATAAERDLEDPLDPEQALWAAASLLSSLKQRFGNLGLAAAAYNAGPRRVSEWLRKRGRLPAETRHYVKAITGRTARSWAVSAKKTVSSIVVDKAGVSCVSAVLEIAESG